uniref:Uncharacterized protein n=1 Tax=Myoviridae sp. ctbEa13 TaxID=2825136 RepID=A0A8S5VBC3_9CAUD|nr:MAG TPA: hypothetical protein [Myoviridae sp. ctbEa13]
MSHSNVVDVTSIHHSPLVRSKFVPIYYITHGGTLKNESTRISLS